MLFFIYLIEKQYNYILLGHCAQHKLQLFKEYYMYKYMDSARYIEFSKPTNMTYVDYQHLICILKLAKN